MKLTFDTSRFRMKPYSHQVQGVRTLLSHPNYGLFWKMRLGKTKAVIDTACILFEAKLIDTVLVVAPAQVKDVWIDKTLGEIKTHDWSGAKVIDYSKGSAVSCTPGKPCYVVASVEYLRQQGPDGGYPLVDTLLASLASRNVWFVFDEASVLGNYKTGNTKAMIALRAGKPIKRVTLLDGTPRGNSHVSFYSKFKVIDPNILGCRWIGQFKNRYCVMGGYAHKEVVGEKNMDDFIKKTSPHCEYLEQDALDMPEKINSILPVKLDEKAWSVYCQMRDELVAQIDSGQCAVQHAAVKCVRLAQICAGFIGGVQEYEQGLYEGIKIESFSHPTIETHEIHDLPTAMLMEWLKARFEERPDFKVVVWARFVPEIERLEKLFIKAGFTYGLLYGEQKWGLESLHPLHTAYLGPFVLLAQAQSAKYGLNLSKADTAIYLSQDYDRVTRAQSEDRIQATGTRKTSQLIDVVVTGPKGQKTITHDIIAIVRGKEDAEKRTAQAWKRILTEE